MHLLLAVVWAAARRMTTGWAPPESPYGLVTVWNGSALAATGAHHFEIGARHRHIGAAGPASHQRSDRHLDEAV
jgi:hypothetical protein